MRKLPSLFVGLLIAVAACSAPSEPFKVINIDLSNKVDENNRPYSPGNVFAPTSTVYASIVTEGTGSAKLGAQWLDADGSTVLADQSQEVTNTKPTTYEFHFIPEGGWTAGKRYKVNLTVDGGQKREREFEIR
jgi:hypothetical protein